jgi:hypothetical protein
MRIVLIENKNHINNWLIFVVLMGGLIFNNRLKLIIIIKVKVKLKISPSRSNN